MNGSHAHSTLCGSRRNSSRNTYKITNSSRNWMYMLEHPHVESSLKARGINQQLKNEHANSPISNMCISSGYFKKLSGFIYLSGTNYCCWLGCNTSKTLSVVNGKAKSTRITLLSCNSDLACVSWWYVIYNMIYIIIFLSKTNNNPNTEHCKYIHYVYVASCAIALFTKRLRKLLLLFHLIS